MAMTYTEALRRLGRRECVTLDKKRGTELRLAPGDEGEAGDIQLRHHGQPLVTFHPDGTFTLRTGGSATKTNIKRISEYAPVAIIRRGHGYWLHDVAGRCAACGGAAPLRPFFDGIRIDQEGRIIGLDTRVRVPPVSTPTSSATTETPPQIVATPETLAALAIQIAGQQVRPGSGPRVAVDAEVTEAVTSTIRQLVAPLRTLLTPAQRRKYIATIHGAQHRGRSPKTGDPLTTAVALLSGIEPSPRSAPAAPPAGNRGECATCGLAWPLHYDRANRFKGCGFAARHHTGSPGRPPRD